MLCRNLVNNGTIIWEAGNFSLFDGITFTNNGSFLDQHNVREPFSGGLYGCALINNGTYSKTGAGQSDLKIPFYNHPGGDIRGIGNISLTYGLSNEGSVSPGDSLGTLNLTVDYPSTSTSELNIEIGGKKADSLYDQLNIIGQATLVNELQQAGKYQVQWNASGFPSGLYYYQLISGEYVAVRKMILVR